MFHEPITRYLDRALEASPRARELCAALDGRRLKVDIRGLPEPLLITAIAGSLRVSNSDAGGNAISESDADVTLSGGPLAWFALAGGDLGDAQARGTVSISGDEHVARQFQELGGLLRPDLEALCGRFMGRIPAHLLTRWLGSLRNWSGAAASSVTRNLADYLAHESRDLVPRAEAEGFLGGVEALRDRLTRAESRIEQLTAGLRKLAAPRDPA